MQPYSKNTGCLPVRKTVAASPLCREIFACCTSDFWGSISERMSEVNSGDCLAISALIRFLLNNDKVTWYSYINHYCQRCNVAVIAQKLHAGKIVGLLYIGILLLYTHVYSMLLHIFKPDNIKPINRNKFHLSLPLRTVWDLIWKGFWNMTSLNHCRTQTHGRAHSFCRCTKQILWSLIFLWLLYSWTTGEYGKQLHTISTACFK